MGNRKGTEAVFLTEVGFTLMGEDTEHIYEKDGLSNVIFPRQHTPSFIEPDANCLNS